MFDVNLFLLAQRIHAILVLYLDPDKQYFTSDKFLMSSSKFGKLLVENNHCVM